MLQSFFRVVSSFTFLAAVVFTIPLAFDVGGRTCGLAFSLSLFIFYALYSILRLITPSESRFRFVVANIVGSLQWVVVPALMIWCLSQYSVDSNRGKWVERTMEHRETGAGGVKEWIAGHPGLVETVTLGAWDKLLRWSIPVCQIAEGFCSLLVMQACGQITKYLVNKENGDNWMIGLLVLSASISSTAVYFLYRVTTFPEMTSLEAILMGSAITCAVMLCGWGVGSGRGNPVESSLLFAYVTLCIYQIFTDYQPANPIPTDQMPAPPQPEFPPLPPIIMASYSTLIHMLSSLPAAIHSGFGFFWAAVMTITPSVIISLAYRVFVMYASTRIIPAVRESGARGLSQEPSLDDHDEVGQVLGLASWFSPSILITVYTSLLMQHFASTSGNGGSTGWWTSQGGDAGGNISRWLNLAITMLLYAVEMHMGRSDHDNLTSHWKVE